MSAEDYQETELTELFKTGQPMCRFNRIAARRHHHPRLFFPTVSSLGEAFRQDYCPLSQGAPFGQ